MRTHLWCPDDFSRLWDRIETELEDPEGPEESKGGRNRYLVLRDQNLPEQKQQQELVKDLTSEMQGKSTTIQDKSRRAIESLALW